MAEIGKNTVQPIVKRKGQILKTVSSPSTTGSKKQVTNIVLDNGVLKASSDNGDTFEDITVKTAQNAQTENAYEIASLVLSDISKTQFKSNTVTATTAIDTSEIVHIASVDTSGLDPALQPYVEGLVNLGGITLYRTSERGFSATFGSVTDVDIRQGLTGSYVLSFIGDKTSTYQLFGTVLSDSTGSGISAIFDNAGNPISSTYAKKTEVNAKYTKPSTGIPESDLAQAVQTSLGKADTALQSVPIATSTKVGGVKPASKTTEMTQSVGVDSNGALWTAPGGGGGITNAEVIEYAEELPTASETSPNFVQTPDGTLYRKKAVEVESLLGTWVFNDNITGLPSIFGREKYYTFSFSSNSENYVKIILGKNNIGYYTNPDGVATTVYTTAWSNTAYKTIQITDISSLTNEAEFTSWLTANATQTGGGAFNYEYVAMQDNSENVVIAQTISAPLAGKTYIQCTLSGTVSPAGNYYFVNCLGSITVSGTSAKLFVTGSPSLTISGITSDNWRNVYIDGEASYIARNSSITVNLNETVTVATGIGNTAAEFYEVNMSIPDNSNRILRGYGNMAYNTPNYDNSKVEYVEFKIDTSGNLTFKPVYGEATFLITWVKFTRRI